ncbi:MAG: hypothetical protein HZB20_03875 [Chloroflexi bacterium]|nr:hypothetical protein [Chloroflexota bacterium]
MLKATHWRSPRWARPPQSPPTVYAGLGHWLTVSAGEWGHGFANRQTRQAFVFLSPALAAEPLLVSRYFVDHYLLNLLMTEWAMLHASCVVDAAGRLILMVASHNTGKSTTALRLMRAGHTFLADGMALLKADGPGLLVGGYPIGEVKLRDDVLALFPEYTGDAVQVREHRKTVVNLRAAHPAQVAESVFTPAAVRLLLVEQGAATAAEPLTDRAQMLAAIAPNTVFWDEPVALEHNTAILNRLLDAARAYRFTLGPDPAQIISAMEALE